MYILFFKYLEYKASKMRNQPLLYVRDYKIITEIKIIYIYIEDVQVRVKIYGKKQMSPVHIHFHISNIFHFRGNNLKTIMGLLYAWVHII